MKQPKLKAHYVRVRRINQRKHTLPHETAGCHLILIKSDPKTWVVKERVLFHNYSEEYETYIPGHFTHYIVLPNWLR
jgi:hypothetical protein